MNKDDNIIVARRLPVWLSVQEKRSIGVWLLPCDAYPVGHVFRAGTPVQTRYIGDIPLLGADADMPDGLIYADSVMGEAGCTFAYVVRGDYLTSASQHEITREQIDYLKKRINFVYAKAEDGGQPDEPVEEAVSCFSYGYWVDALAWSNAMPWVNI